MEEPSTPSSLRWTPVKRPVTVERKGVRSDRAGGRTLGSPVQMRDKENIGAKLKALAPPPPLLPLAPQGPRAISKNTKNQVAERLRQRLQFAYYKVRTQQQHRPLPEVSVAPLCI